MNAPRRRELKDMQINHRDESRSLGERVKKHSVWFDLLRKTLLDFGGKCTANYVADKRQH